jgi:D-beta-D-heptose 7-phosphate kinase/D-beta-D-heptose 1-phosphate adenosyltransferase
MNILLLGDIILDTNYYCTTNRNAAEANIPVYNNYNIEHILGGAANVSQNFVPFDINVNLISVIGNDKCGKKIKSLLSKKKIIHTLFVENNRKTTNKNRIVCDNKIVSRYDIEDTFDINKNLEIKIINYIKKQKNINAIVFSDYNKGLLTYNLCKLIIEFANINNILTFVDPKIKDTIKYKNCFCVKLNLYESIKIFDQKNYFGQIPSNENIQYIKNKLNCKHVIITCGENGIIVNNIENWIIHDKKINAIDTTGCGDIVLSTLTSMYLINNNIYESCKISNFLAGKSVFVLGNYNISKKDICEYYLKPDILNQSIESVIIYDTEINKLENLKKNNKKMIFTNGCFDIIHSAHIKLLQFSKKQGEILVVGINSDESVKNLKGDIRPINNINERCELLKSLNIINYIVIFNDSTPLNVIKLLKPNVIIKGGDYNKEDIVGKEYADDVLIFNYIDGISSTNVINKIYERV